MPDYLHKRCPKCRQPMYRSPLKDNRGRPIEICIPCSVKKGEREGNIRFERRH